MTGTLQDDQNTLMIIPLRIFLTMRNVSEINCGENQNTVHVR